MHRIDTADAAASPPAVAPAGVPGYFTEGDSLLSIPCTTIADDWLNAVQEEIGTAVEAMGSTLDKADNSQLITAILRAAAQGAVGNVLINPDFRVWQRHGIVGPTFNGTALGFKGPDRWLFKSGHAGDTSVLSQHLLTVSVEGSASGAFVVLRWNKSVAGGTGECGMRQRAENVATLQARPVVVAWDAKKNAGSNVTISSVELVQNFGTGGSADVVTALSAQAGTTIDGNWRRLVFSGTLPTIVGKTVVTADHFLELRIKFAENQTFDILQTAFTLSRGTRDPGFFSRPIAQEVALCQRYFESSRKLNRGPTQSGSDGNELAMWDTGYDLSAQIGTLRRRFFQTKYPESGAYSITWYALDGTANSVTREGATLEAVTSTPETGELNHTGSPTLTSPPAANTVRQYRARWACAAEIGTET